MLSVTKNSRLCYLTYLFMVFWSGLLVSFGVCFSACAGSDVDDININAHWATRFEVSGKKVFVDEFDQLPEELFEEITQYSQYLASDQNGLLLYWSFPETINPDITSCLEPVTPSARVQLLASQSVGQAPDFELSRHNESQALRLNLSASEGVLLLAVDGYQVDMFCPQAKYLQETSRSGKMIAVYFGKPWVEQALSAPQNPGINKSYPAGAEEANNSTTPGQASPSDSSESAETPEYVQAYGGSGGGFDSQDKPKKGRGIQLQPVQIVIMLPAISLGAGGLIEIPAILSSLFHHDNSEPEPEPEIVTQLYDPPEHNQGFSVVLLQVTDSFGGVHQISIAQQYWIKIVEQGLHRNAAFLHNLAVQWPRHNQQRTALEEMLEQLMADYHREVNTLLSGNATAEDSEQMFQRAQVILYDLERLWQSLARLIPRRLWVILEQHAEGVVRQLWRALTGSLVASIDTEKTETVTVKGITSCNNGTGTGATSTTQTSGTYSAAGGSSSYRYAGAGGSRQGQFSGLPSRGFSGGGGSESWRPPGHEAGSTPMASPVDFEAYITDNFSKPLVVKGSDVNSQVRMLSFHVSSGHQAILLWMVGGPMEDSLERVRETPLSSAQARFLRGYLYVMADVLGLVSLKPLLDPLGLLADRDNLDILWQTTHSTRSYVKNEDALDVIAKLNMVIMTKQYATDHFLSLKNFVANDLGQISAADSLKKIYNLSAGSGGGRVFATLKLVEKIYQSMAGDPQISDGSFRDYISRHNFLTHLPNITRVPRPLPALLDHLPREKSVPTGLQPDQGMKAASTLHPNPLSSLRMTSGDRSLPSYSAAMGAHGAFQAGLMAPSHFGYSSSVTSNPSPSGAFRRGKRPLPPFHELLPETKKSTPDRVCQMPVTAGRQFSLGHSRLMTPSSSQPQFIPLHQLQAHLKTDPSSNREIGNYVLTGSGGWFIQAGSHQQWNFLVRQLDSSPLEQYSDLYLTLPDHIAFVEAVQPGAPVSVLLHQMYLLNDWIRHIFSQGYGVPPLPTVNSLRMLRQGGRLWRLFAMRVPTSNPMPGFTFIPIEQLRELAEIIIDMVLRATGVTLQSPHGMPSPARATLYKFLKLQKAVTSEHHLFIDMALELNGSIHGLTLEQLSLILTRKVSPPVGNPVRQQLPEPVSGLTEPDVSDTESEDSFFSAKSSLPDDEAETDDRRRLGGTK